jgi:hypothetical protein
MVAALGVDDEVPVATTATMQVVVCPASYRETQQLTQPTARSHDPRIITSQRDVTSRGPLRQWRERIARPGQLPGLPVVRWRTRW